MRVLRLELSDGPVELHPFLTVVRGLSPTAREELLAALAALPRGRARTSGLLEAHGVLLDLVDDTLELLDLRGDLDVIVRSTDLPGGPAGAVRVADARRVLAEADAAAADAVLELERAEQGLAAAREALDAARATGEATDDVDRLAGSRAELERRAMARAEAQRMLDEAVAAEQAAARAVLDAEADVAAAQAARADATAAVAEASAALEAASERRDPMAAAALDAAETAVADAEAAVAAADAASDGAASSAVEPAPAVVETRPRPTAADIAALRAARIEAEAGVLALDTSDPFPIRLALEQLESDGAVELVPDPRATAVADELTGVVAELGTVGDADEPTDAHVGGEALAAARARVQAAQDELAVAEAAVRGPSVDPEAAKALEVAHDAVLEARDLQDRRRRRGDVAQRVAEAEAAEEAALARLGFATWTDYLMGQHKGGRDPAAPQRAAAARAELAAATAEADALAVAVAAELRRAELRDRRRELRADAAAVLGDAEADVADDVLLDRLRQRRVPITETGAHLARLRDALEATGVVLGDEDLPQRTLCDLARVWLEEQGRALAERHALEARVAELDARIAEAERAREAEPAADGEAGEGGDAAATRVGPLAAALQALESARAGLTAARARQAAHVEAEAEVVARREAFEQVSQEEQAAVAATVDAEAALVAARAREREAAAGALDAGAALDAAIDAEHLAAATLAGFEERLASTADRVEAIEADLVRASAAVSEARAAVAQTEAEAITARQVLKQAEADAVRLDADVADPVADAEDAEWFLLARLAGQRAMSFAGSVPLVLDDALAAFDPDNARRLLARLERMASTVQVVVVTEDLGTAAWAESIGPERAAVSQR